ncbi:MAG: chemotaxis protein CheA [Chromatiales bacterium]|nr:chemotaxis protein CheA [Chromatiales bacterium]
MALDMSQFLQTFYEESAEGLETMETGLLNLDVGRADSEEINTIFRAAHSIKGGSATFGLQAVADFTHHMETLLDELRDGRRAVSQEVVTLLLESVDALRELLSASQSNQPVDAERINATGQKMQALLGVEAAASEITQSVNSMTGGIHGWSIQFNPHRDIFMSGNDPMRIIAELNDLAEMEISLNADELPLLGDLNPEESYLSWDITLHGDLTRDALMEVFAWVEGECDLTITEIVDTATERETAAEAPAEMVRSEPVVENVSRVEMKREEKRGSGDGGSIRVAIEKVDAVINLVGELVITQSMLSTLGENFESGQIQSLRDGLAQLERNTRELQEDVMRMRMLPISFVFNRFPRLVHDLSAKLGKSVELRMTGESTEVDKTVTEKLSDPLVHLIRNSMDHGIEQSANERRKAGKSETGVVELNAYHKGGNIVIEVRDDGRGLNAEKIRQKAIEKGLIEAERKLSDEECYELIMLPGFSTAETLSDVSGRGVGMDVVRKNIQSLGGSVEVTSEPGLGSCFTVRLPLTLAILDGQTVRVGRQNYIVPLVSIVESIQLRGELFNQVAGKGETFNLRDQYIPVIRLHDIFNEPQADDSEFGGLLMVVESEGNKVALMVDELLAQQQVVIKSMEANYERVCGISGATILGDGTVALILDINGIIQMHRGRFNSCAA